MTVKEFIESSSLYADELYFEINSDGKTKYNLTKQELCFYYDKRIKQFEFIASGDICGESCLTITFYI